MKKLLIALIALILMNIQPAAASDIFVTASMQRCTSNEQCVLVSKDCDDACSQVPVNKGNLPILDKAFVQHCGRPLGEAGQCSSRQDLQAACINSRCTIGYAYKHHASAEDYKPGAYPVPEAPVPYKGDHTYSDVNDRTGNFTAYDLPGDIVHRNVMGQYDAIQ